MKQVYHLLALISFLLFSLDSGFSQISCVSPSVTSIHTGDDAGNEAYYLQFSVSVVNPDGLAATVVKVTDPDSLEYTLFDDGMHEDNGADDGIFGNQINKGLQVPKTGNYKFTASDSNDIVEVFDVLDLVLGYPTNTSPADGSVVSDPNPPFRWTLPSGTLFFTLNVYNETDSIIWTRTGKGTTVTYEGPALENGKTYNWDIGVRVNDALGLHNKSSFRFDLDQGIPVLTWPYVSSIHYGNDTGSTGWELIFDVSAFDPQGLSDITNVTVTVPNGVTTWELFDDGLHDDLAASDGNYGSVFKLSEQPQIGNYTFRVRDVSGNEAIIIDVLDNNCDYPKNTRPANNMEIKSNPVFSWDSVAGEIFYMVAVYNDAGELMWNQGADSTSLKYNNNGLASLLIPGNTYHWTVSCFNDDAKGTHEPSFFKYLPEDLDSLALVALYNSTNGPGWNRNDNWLTGPVSTWYGVTVESNRVTRLDLFQNNLNGRIPEEIGWLTGLNSLQMGLNNFNGSVIPNQIGNLINLNYLDFYSSNIGGSLPVEIGSLNNLQQLQLSHNSLSGPIPAEIGNLSNLRNFYLHENQFSGNIPATIGNLSQLNSLLLFQNSLSGSIPATLCNLMNLERLYLNNNQLTGEIPSEIGNLNTLMELSLGYNQLSGSIPPEIGNLSNLNYVILSDNYFSGSVPNSIQSLSKLFLLFLHNNQLTDMPDLGMLDKLDYLYIYNNRLDFDDIEPNVGVPNIVFGYVPQQPVGDFQFYTINEGDAITLSVSVGGSHNVYQWYRDGIWLEGKNSNTLVINKATSDQTGSYVCYITNTVATDLTLYSNPIYLTVFETTHFVPVWQGTAGLDHMNFYASKAQIDGTDMQPGDEIGIFDGEICVGTATVVSIVDNMNMLEIRISKDDPYTPQTDGYTEGHQATFKIWDDRKQSEISNVSVIYLSGNDIFTAGASSFIEIRGIGLATQEIALQAGWNIFSLDVTPENISMMNILQPLITSGALMKVQSETGSAIEPIPGSSLWIDNIGNWSVTEGYKIRLNKPETLVVMGAPVQGTVNINLQTGWNIMSYPFATSQDAMGALNSIIMNGHLMKVQNESGAAIEPLPAGMGWINNIGTFQPGEGYKIRVSANDILSLSENTSSFEGDLKSAKDVHTPQYFRPVWTNNGLDHMNVYVSGSFQEGDEIAVYDGDICVGALKINYTGSDYYSIPISADDPESFETDGFITGNSLTIRMWNALSGTETNPEFSILQGYTSTMEPMGTTFADIKQTGNQTILGNNYPNPFRTETIIPFTLAENNRVEISIFNLMGQKITTLVSADLKADSYHVTWNGTYGSGEKAPSGIYLCKMTVGQQVIVNRIEITD